MFSVEAKFHASGPYDIDFIGVKSYKGFDHEKWLGLKFYTLGHFPRSNLLYIFKLSIAIESIL